MQRHNNASNEQIDLLNDLQRFLQSQLQTLKIQKIKLNNKYFFIPIHYYKPSNIELAITYLETSIQLFNVQSTEQSAKFNSAFEKFLKYSTKFITYSDPEVPAKLVSAVTITAGIIMAACAAAILLSLTIATPTAALILGTVAVGAAIIFIEGICMQAEAWLIREPFNALSETCGKISDYIQNNLITKHPFSFYHHKLNEDPQIIPLVVMNCLTA